MKYQVQIKYTNPSHEHVSLRRRVESVTRLVEAANEQEAINRATKQQRALGFNITEAEVYAPVTGLHSLALNNNEPQKGKEKKKVLVGKDGEKTDIAAAGGVKKEEKGGTESYPLLKKGEKLKPMKIGEGFDTDPKDIAAYLVDRHGKGKVTMDHIEAYERRRDSHRPIEKHEVMKHVKKMSEEVEAVEEGADDWKKAFKRVAAKNYEKDIAAVRSSAHRLDKATQSFPAKPDTKPTDSNIDYIKQKARKGVTKPHSMQEEVGADKRVAGYKMSDAVRKAQKKSDELSKVEKKPQAGTLAAQKSRKAAERMVNRAKGNTNKIDVAPTIEPGKPNLQR